MQGVGDRKSSNEDPCGMPDLRRDRTLGHGSGKHIKIEAAQSTRLGRNVLGCGIQSRVGTGVVEHFRGCWGSGIALLNDASIYLIVKVWEGVDCSDRRQL